MKTQMKYHRMPFIRFCTVRQEKVHLNFEILTCDPFMCTMYHPRLNVSSQMEEFISIQRVDLKFCSSGSMRVKRREMKIELNFWCKFSSVLYTDF